MQVIYMQVSTNEDCTVKRSRLMKTKIKSSRLKTHEIQDIQEFKTYNIVRLDIC